MLEKRNVFLRYFPPPKFLTMEAGGFEVTEEAIRFIKLDKSGKGKRVVHFDEVKLSPSDDPDNFLEGERIRASAIEFVKKNKIGDVNVGLPDEKVYIFKTEIPGSPTESEIRSAIELRLEEFVPVPPKEAIFDYQIINSGKNNHLNISVSVLPRLVVEKYSNFMESLGIGVVSMNPIAQATADCVIESGDMTSSIIVNIGQRKTSLYIVNAGIVHFASTVAIGGISLTEALSKHLKVGMGEAEEIKKEKGVFKDKKNPDLFFALLTTLSSIKDEITKLVQYWDSHKERYTDDKSKIERIILCGEEAGLKGMAEYLDATSGMNVLLANVWVNINSLDAYIPPITREESLGYAGVIGLALDKFK